MGRGGNKIIRQFLTAYQGEKEFEKFQIHFRGKGPALPADEIQIPLPKTSNVWAQNSDTHFKAINLPNLLGK